MAGTAPHPGLSSFRKNNRAGAATFSLTPACLTPETRLSDEPFPAFRFRPRLRHEACHPRQPDPYWPRPPRRIYRPPHASPPPPADADAGRPAAPLGPGSPAGRISTSHYAGHCPERPRAARPGHHHTGHGTETRHPGRRLRPGPARHAGRPEPARLRRQDTGHRGPEGQAGSDQLLGHLVPAVHPRDAGPGQPGPRAG